MDAFQHSVLGLLNRTTDNIQEAQLLIAEVAKEDLLHKQLETALDKARVNRAKLMHYAEWFLICKDGWATYTLPELLFQTAIESIVARQKTITAPNEEVGALIRYLYWDLGVEDEDSTEGIRNLRVLRIYRRDAYQPPKPLRGDSVSKLPAFNPTVKPQTAPQALTSLQKLLVVGSVILTLGNISWIVHKKVSTTRGAKRHERRKALKKKLQMQNLKG